jgi:hypothetical protein
MTPGGEGHLALLEMKARVGQLVEIADVIVVQMGNDDVGDRVGFDADQFETLDRAAQELALAPCRDFRGKAGVDQERAIRSDDDQVK